MSVGYISLDNSSHSGERKQVIWQSLKKKKLKNKEVIDFSIKLSEAEVKNITMCAGKETEERTKESVKSLKDSRECRKTSNRKEETDMSQLRLSICWFNVFFQF